MLPKARIGLTLALVLVVAGSLSAADLERGRPELKSAGPLAFGPDGILFVGDTNAGAIFAIDTGDKTPAKSAEPLKVEAVDRKVASLLGTSPEQILLNDLAVNPASGNAYLAVSRGKGPDAQPVLVRVDRSGKVEEFSLKDVRFARANLPNPTAGSARGGRQEAITDIAFVDGKVIVAGLSNEEFASKLRAIPFPFKDADAGTSVEIFHGAHGRFETNAPVRTFVPYTIGGQPHVVAAYTCTPLVRFPLSDLKPGAKVKGTTIAELGNRNRPLDMIAYEKGGKSFLLMANSSRGVMKIPTEGFGSAEGITKPVTGGGTAGIAYETISDLKNVQHLDKLDKDRALVLVQGEGGALHLETIALP
jgi:hypothetical protein